MIATMNLHRYFLILLVVLPLCSPLRAQGTDEDSRFYLGFAGSAVFPYDPKEQSNSGGEGINFKTGAGFTAAFGYAFKEGFSTEIEWGYQKSGIGPPTENLSQEIDFGDPAGLEGLRPPITIEIDGELKTQSLMGNVYYRYPKWRVSPYAGFGLGAFFHDGGFTSIVTVTDDFLPGGITSGFGNDLFAVPPGPQSDTRIPGLPIRSWEASRSGPPVLWSSALAIAFAQAGERRSMPTRLRRESG